MRWDNPEDRWNLHIYQTGIFFLGVSLLAMAFFAALCSKHTKIIFIPKEHSFC